MTWPNSAPKWRIYSFSVASIIACVVLSVASSPRDMRNLACISGTTACLVNRRGTLAGNDGSHFAQSRSSFATTCAIRARCAPWIDQLPPMMRSHAATLRIRLPIASRHGLTRRDVWADSPSTLPTKRRSQPTSPANMPIAPFFRAKQSEPSETRVPRTTRDAHKSKRAETPMGSTLPHPSIRLNERAHFAPLRRSYWQGLPVCVVRVPQPCVWGQCVAALLGWLALQRCSVRHMPAVAVFGTLAKAASQPLSVVPYTPGMISAEQMLSNRTQNCWGVNSVLPA